MKKILLLMCFFTSIGNFAQTITSAQTGDWHDTATWAGGVVPIASNDVVIATGHSVTVRAGFPAEMNNLHVNSGSPAGQFKQAAGSAVTINGTVTSSRSQDFYTFDASASEELGTLLYTGVTPTQRILYTKRLPAADQWHLVSFGIFQNRVAEVFHVSNNFAKNASNLFSFATYDGSLAAGNKYVYPYDDSSDPASQRLDPVPGNTVYTLDGQGFSLKARSGVTNADIRSRGRFPVADVNIDISDAGDQFNLLGNPYPSFLQANSNSHATNNILTVNAAILEEQTIWLWNGTTQAWVTKNQMSDAFNVSPSQGFFVRAKSGGDAVESFSFTNAMRTHTKTDNFFKTTNNIFKVELGLSVDKMNKSTEIFYTENATLSFDNGFDSSIFSGTESGMDIFTNLVDNGAKKLAIQTLPNNDLENVIVPIGVKAAANSEISFTANALNIPSGVNVYLEDRSNNTFTKLNEENVKYTTTVSGNLTEGRFYLHTKSGVLSTESALLNSVSIYKSDENTLRIVGLTQTTASVKMYNVLGKQVMSSTIKANGVNELALPKLTKGVYIVQLETETGTLNKKIVLE